MQVQWSTRGPGSSGEDSHYDVLQVAQHATPDVIEAAYRALARQWHPDTNEDPSASEQMARLNAAYAVLRDEEARATYDASLALRTKPARNHHPGGVHRRLRRQHIGGRAAS